MHRVDELREWAAREPDNHAAWVMWAMVLDRLGRREEAMAAIQEILRCNPNSSGPYGMLAGQLRALGRHDEALAAARTAAELDPEDPRAWVGLGLTLYEMGSFDEAAAAMERCIEISPQHPAGVTILSKLLADEGELGRAAEVLAQGKVHGSAACGWWPPAMLEWADQAIRQLRSGVAPASWWGPDLDAVPACSSSSQATEASDIGVKQTNGAGPAAE